MNVVLMRTFAILTVFALIVVPAHSADWTIGYEGKTQDEFLGQLSEAGVELLEIDPLEVGAPEADYPALLRAQADAFARALECRGPPA
ncbi:MAG: hypothetical protein KY432_00150 [Acidobacteria bacterium]|nr:hypothetical protein [Acidobacteriota bacterium]